MHPRRGATIPFRMRRSVGVDPRPWATGLSGSPSGGAGRLQNSGETVDSGGLTGPDIAAELGLTARELLRSTAWRRSSGCQYPLPRTFESDSRAGRTQLHLCEPSVG